MADEIRKVITVDVSGAVSSLEDLDEATESAGYSFKSLGDAKKYIDKLKASLIDLDEESEEYANTVKEISDVQEKMDKAIKATGTTLKGAEGSYNALSKQMAELKKQFKETNDEAERNALAKQIVTINDQLKSMDASIGNFQRNVGNYEGAFTKGLSNITEKITALGNPLAIARNGVNSLGKALKSLVTNPAGAVIMAIVAALAALKKGFAGSEEASNSLKRAFAAFQPVINALNNVFTGFANIVGKIAEKAIPALIGALQKAGEWMMKLLNKIGIVSDERLEAYRKSIEAQKEAMRVTQELTEREIQLEERKRKLQVEVAKGEYNVSVLRNKAADKDKYTAEERQKFLEDAIKAERALNAAKLAVVQEEFNILNERSKLTDNNKADNDALAAAEAQLWATRKEYYDKEKSLIKELSSVKGELNAEEKKALEEAEKAQKKAEEEAIKLREKELEKIKEINERVVLSAMNKSDRSIAILKKQYEDEKKLLEKYGQDTVALTEEYNRNIAEIRVEEGEKKLKEFDEQAALEQFIADKTIQIEWEKKERLLEIDRERLEGEKAIYEELLQLDNLSAEKKEEYALKLQEINASIVENSNNTKLAQQQHINELVETYSKMAEGIGNILNTVAGYYQDNVKARVKAGKMTEQEGKKEFEKTKKLQIAAAIINGLAGIATAISSAMQLGPILGPIMGAINATAVAVSTGVQIAKIKSTTLDGGGSVSGSSTSTSTPTEAATAYTPNYQTNITGESETSNLANAISGTQNDQRVYVVESDINEVGRRVEVRESESTF